MDSFLILLTIEVTNRYKLDNASKIREADISAIADEVFELYSNTKRFSQEQEKAVKGITIKDILN